MKVTTSCYGRFHIFDQAHQLHKHGMLYQLINDYPKFMSNKWGIPDQKVISLLANGIYGRFARKISKNLKPEIRSKITESVHHHFSSRLKKHLQMDTDVFIGLSSFSLEAIDKANENDIYTIVDHGSLHQRTERMLLDEENDLHGLSVDRNLSPDWIIEKEDAEFLLADKIFVLSNIARKSLIQEGVDKEKIFVNQCGVDLQQFMPGKKEDNIFRIIQCGGINQRKGVQYLLKAFTELKLPNSELWFIGGGLSTTPLKTIIKKYKADNVYYKGVYPQHELSKLYSQGSVFVLASIADGFGMVVPQAMACGLPVIVTDHVGAADIVEDGKTGYIISSRNVDDLKQKILYCYENFEMTIEMGRLAHQFVKKGQTWDDYGIRLTNFIKNINY